MAEYIKRDPMVEICENQGHVEIDDILSVPAADVAKVVRCRDCRCYKEHRTKKHGNLICRCTRMGKHDMDYPVKPDDFCSYGEKPTDNLIKK